MTDKSDRSRRDDALLTAIAAISHAANADADLSRLLQRLADVAAAHLDVDGAGVMRLEGGVVEFVHASAPDVAELERLQAAHQQGPCRLATAQRSDVIVDDVTGFDAESWQPYLAAANSAGMRSVVAIPLVSHGRCWGALDLYRCRPGPWSEHDLSGARLLAELAASYEALAHLGTHDPLTGLPNRTLIFDRLDHALTAAARRGTSVAVFFLDIDHFKQINDTFGHAAGDEVLVEISRRLLATSRQEDTLGRLAGDELVLICEDLPQHPPADFDSHMAGVTERMRHALSEPISVGHIQITVAMSIGVAFWDGATSAADLLGDADAAMYRSKQRRRAAAVLRDTPAIMARLSARVLERQLAEALRDAELRVHYQPIVSADGARLEAVEALLRWQHPEHGLLSAGDFIEIAERSGLIIPIGQWVIDQSCCEMTRWREQLADAAPRTVYVNVSARELTDPSLEPSLRASLERHSLGAEAIGFELVEASFIHPTLVNSLLRHEQHGHPLSVDDFGTGYSSLSRLVELPVRLAKIDQSFVGSIAQDRRRRAFVEAVLTVANSLGLQVVAEGVETQAQAQVLRDAGCHLLQGYYYAPALTAADLTQRYAS